MSLDIVAFNSPLCHCAELGLNSGVYEFMDLWSHGLGQYIGNTYS